MDIHPKYSPVVRLREFEEMATKRQKNNGWEYVVKRKALLPKPLYYTFDNEDEGDAFVARLEALLDKGIVPKELFEKSGSDTGTVGSLIRDYVRAMSVPESDQLLLNVSSKRIGDVPLTKMTYEWIEGWIRTMKIERNLSVDTIKHHVGALGRCFDWASRRNIVPLVINPIRQLPKSYATYNEDDIATATALNPEFDDNGDGVRDRRLEAGEEEAIRAVLNKVKPEDKQRPLDLKHQGALELIFELALESAMRMREMYTLTTDQIDIPRRTIFLDKTKNGSKRQVPLSRKAIASIERYMSQVKAGERGMSGFAFPECRVFPWWNGNESKEVLRMTSSKLSVQFRRIFDAAKCEDLRFHDLRHEGTSRLFERTKLREYEIMKITGHSSTRQLARYGNLRASDLASMLD